MGFLNNLRWLLHLIQNLNLLQQPTVHLRQRLQQLHRKKNLKEIKELVTENGRSIVKVEEKVEFSTIVSLYGNEIISLRTAEKAFLKNLRFDRNGAIEESAAQRRFMETALGHQPGSQFRGLEALMDMITKGTGSYFRFCPCFIT